jgi:hypothetical protein
MKEKLLGRIYFSSKKALKSSLIAYSRDLAAYVCRMEQITISSYKADEVEYLLYLIILAGSIFIYYHRKRSKDQAKCIQ